MHQKAQHGKDSQARTAGPASPHQMTSARRTAGFVMQTHNFPLSRLGPVGHTQNRVVDGLHPYAPWSARLPAGHAHEKGKYRNHLLRLMNGVTAVVGVVYMGPERYYRRPLSVPPPRTLPPACRKMAVNSLPGAQNVPLLPSRREDRERDPSMAGFAAVPEARVASWVPALVLPSRPAVLPYPFPARWQ